MENKNVYMVGYYDYDADDIYGVFSSIEKAQEVRDKIIESKHKGREHKVIINKYCLDEEIEVL